MTVWRPRPVSGHLHVHDSFGRPQAHYEAYYQAENVAMGIGDLHLPVGWGDIDWDGIFAELEFLPGTVMILEIGMRYRSERAACLARAKGLAGL